MIVVVREAIYPAQITSRPTREEVVGTAILGLLRNDQWTWSAREVVPAPALGGARVVRRYRREGGALEVREIRCSREVYEEVEKWLAALPAAGWWGGPISPPPTSEGEKGER